MSFSTNNVNHRACRGNELPEEQQDQNRKYSVVQPTQLLPASQLPRRHSSAAPLIPQAPQNEVPHTNRVDSKRIPPAVPARNRKRSNTNEESTTHKSMAINTAPHSTIAQYPNPTPSNPFLSDSKHQTQETQAHNTNPFVDKAISKPKVNLPTPPAIPPPPTRSRRASTSFQTFDGYLDPRNSALVQRRSSSPFQNYTNNTRNDLSPNYTQSCLNSSAQLKPVENPRTKDADDKHPGEGKNSLTPKPTVTFSNVQQLEKQKVPPNENGKKISPLKMMHLFANDKPDDRKPLNSQKPLLNRSTTDSCETRIESEKTRVSGQESKVSMRQDSNVSSDSMSQTSSPSYNTKTMETPLLLHHIRKMGNKQNICDMIKAAEQNTANNAALTKSLSTPASLQTCVKFTESNMTLQHRIIRDVRRPSTNYFTRGRLKFRIIQVIVNAFALLALAGGLAVYFRSTPTPVRYINKTITTTIAVIPPETNPAPGFCLAIVVPFCANHRIPYNYTTFPNHVVNVNQQQAEQGLGDESTSCAKQMRKKELARKFKFLGFCVNVFVDFCIYHRVPYNYTTFPSGHQLKQVAAVQELELYDALVDVRCYELSALFLCSVIVPKCGNQGEILYPCRSLCEEMKRRCGFFLPVFGLPAFPEYLVTCTLLPDSENPNVCVGHREVKEAKIRAHRPRCSSAGFLCDYSRCIPLDWKCDGHLDCEDESDETDCHICPEGMVHCGENKCMNKSHLCDGIVHCPYGQDERNCLRLQEKMGDTARGMLQIFDAKIDKWIPACVSNWDSRNSPQAICSLMGYKVVNSSRFSIKDTNIDVPPPQTANWTEYKKSTNWMREFRSCGTHHYPIVSLECSHYDCGKRRTMSLPSKRIVGGSQSQPGDWPFLAAILGGPEEIFYCAGVLISEQWVLSASHCVGNQTDIDGWKIQLGLTRRHSHNYYGLKTKVKRVIRHPYYKVGGNHDHDVALFQLKHPVNFNEHLLPVCLPPPGRELVPGTNCIVIGWGKSMDLDISEYEPTINEVEVPVIEREVCNDWLIYRDYNVTDGMICAGFAEGGKDACQGDSGGPLLCPFDRQQDRWFVGGIVSWGIKCAHPQLPGVYAYVPKYLSWIKNEIQKYTD